MGTQVWEGQISSTTAQVTSLPSANTNGGTLLTLTADPLGRFVYAAQQATPTGTGSTGVTGVGIFFINPATQALTAGPTTILNAIPNPILVPASGNSIYLTESGAIRAFSVTSNGLIPVAGSPFTVNTVGALSAITPDGRFLISVGSGSAAVFAIDPLNKVPPAEISGSPFITGASGEQAVAISPNGNFLFILTADSTNGRIITLAISSHGSLAVVPECIQTSPKTIGCSAPPVLGPVNIRQETSAIPSMVVDPTSSLLYVLAADTSGASRIAGLQISIAGQLGTLASSPFAQDITPNSMAMDKGGHFLYVGSSQGTLFTYEVTSGGTLGRLSSIASFQATGNMVAVP
jgi:hypothetical protein